MGWFTKKGRLAEHQEQLTMARRALDALRVEVRRMPDGKIVHGWDGKTVPLEYRDLVNQQVETLVFYVYDEGAERLAGSWDGNKDLAQALAFVQVALTDSASIASTTQVRRQALRARTFATLLEEIERWAADDESGALGANPFITRSDREAFLVRQIADASEALGWFTKQEDLDAAVRVRSEVDETALTRLSLDRMRSAIEKLRAMARRNAESP